MRIKISERVILLKVSNMLSAGVAALSLVIMGWGIFSDKEYLLRQTELLVYQSGEERLSAESKDLFDNLTTGYSIFVGIMGLLAALSLYETDEKTEESDDTIEKVTDVYKLLCTAANFCESGYTIEETVEPKLLTLPVEGQLVEDPISTTIAARKMLSLQQNKESGPYKGADGELYPCKAIYDLIMRDK